MSLEHVRAFYFKVANDESFRSQIQSVSSKEECTQLVKSAGFDFTSQEFEKYTEELLEHDHSGQEVSSLPEEDLVAVTAGAYFFSPKFPVRIRPMYGISVLRPRK